MPTPREGTKCTVACNYCRLKKVKCNGARPCTNCTDHRENCVYPVVHQRTRKKANEANKMLEERLARMETLLQASMAAQAQAQTPNLNMSYQTPAPTECHPFPRELNGHTPTPSDFQRDMNLLQSPASMGQSGSPLNSVMGNEHNGDMGAPSLPQLGVSVPNNILPHSPPQTASPQSSIRRMSNAMSVSDTYSGGGEMLEYQLPQQSSANAPEEAVVSPQMSNSEHHGPVSYLSICSNPGMKWVSERVGASDFATSANTLSLDVTRNLKMDRKISQHRVSDPDPATAWRYTHAYFDESLDKVFGVVHRPMFEARLQAHFQQEELDTDTAWYALRHTVFASGCKIVHTKEDRPNAFVEAQEKAWAYFENALSVHTDLLYMRTGLSAVQALLAMAFFTEGLGNPALEYMLVSNALRLAQSKGLHRQPVETWNMREPEIQHRNWLFWAIYAYEKHIAYRSGRPSAIDDDDIGCEIPTAVLEGSAINFDFFISVIKHAQVASSIAKELSSVKASKQPPEVIIQRAQDVERRLRDWKDSIPPHLRPDLPFNQAYLPPGTHLYHIIYLHFAFYGSLIAIHSVFTYPWNSNGFTHNPTPTIKEQIAASTQTVVEASRKIILATKYIDSNGSWPTCHVLYRLTFFYPLLGLINLFVYVLKFPNQPSAPSDIALMDVVAGHFGFLEFASNSKIAFPFTGEITSLARATVKKARERTEAGQEHQQIESQSTLMTLMAEPHLQQSGVDSLYSIGEYGSMDNMDIGLDNWPSFLPSFSRVSSMAMHGLLGDEDLDFIPMN